MADWKVEDLRVALARTLHAGRLRLPLGDKNMALAVFHHSGRISPRVSVTSSRSTKRRKSYALDRTQPGLPMKKGRAGTMTHDYNATAHNAIRCSRRTRGRAGRHLRLNGDEEAHKLSVTMVLDHRPLSGAAQANEEKLVAQSNPEFNRQAALMVHRSQDLFILLIRQRAMPANALRSHFPELRIVIARNLPKLVCCRFCMTRKKVVTTMRG